MKPLRAFLPLDAELVLTCADCGKPSSADAFGAQRWTLRRVSAQRLVDVCPCCAPQRPVKIGPPPAGRV
jgi:hypothetical protein